VGAGAVARMGGGGGGGGGEDGLSGGEALHDEGVRAMGAGEDWGADAVRADEVADAGDGEFELFGLGRDGDEEAVLGAAGLDGFGGEVDFEDRGGGGTAVEVELEHAEEGLVVQHGDGEAESGFVGGRVFEGEAQAEFVGGERALFQAGADIGE
jgi:hypothetical protein